MGEEGEIITRQEGPNQVVHIRTDSNGILDAMFNKVLKNPDAQNNVPYADRREYLPRSFFIQPRSSNEFDGISVVDKRSGQSGQIQHVRSRSSPASINQSLSLPPQTATPPAIAPQSSVTPLHHRQRSVPSSTIHSQQSQLYNQVSLNPTYRAANLADGKIVFQNRHTLEIYPDSPRVRDQIVGALPQYWAQQQDQGETYYIDHSKRTTTWFDPRLPKEIQNLFVYGRHQSQHHSQQHNSPGNGIFGSLNNSTSAMTAGAGAQQHQFSQPVITNPAQSQSSFLSNPYDNHGHVPQNAAASLSQQSQHSPQPVLLPQQVQTLKRLEMEREMMKLRQKEIQQQQIQKQSVFGDGHLSAQASLVPDGSGRRQMPDYEMMGSPMSAVSGLQLSDPFLGPYHGRQESGDSGFSASTPHTPENFLSQTMEEMSLYQGERWDGDGNSMNGPSGTAENMVSGQTISEDVNMDGPEELTDFLLSDLESVLSRTDKADPFVTWL